MMLKQMNKILVSICFICIFVGTACEKQITEQRKPAIKLYGSKSNEDNSVVLKKKVTGNSKMSRELLDKVNDADILFVRDDGAFRTVYDEHGNVVSNDIAPFGRNGYFPSGERRQVAVTNPDIADKEISAVRKSEEMYQNVRNEPQSVGVVGAIPIK